MIIGTAGHIDHGKSALVTALTGRPVDRLIEERRRGITIDLNFAPLEFEGLPPAGIVDVPGHEDFVRTMVAGASGIDLVLLVVDASQGAQPQTWEHLAIVEQLRIPCGIPVLTKADLADPEWLELVRAELTQRLAASPVAFESPLVTSVVTGQGLGELRERLRERVMMPARSRDDRFRMPIDRAFSIAGVGTVVTGTPWSGAAAVGGEVTVLPEGNTVRVRSVEAYGRAVDAAVPGARTAIGLAGLARERVGRGNVLVGAGEGWRCTTAFDAAVELLPHAPALRRRLRVRLHLGTAEIMARLYPAGGLVRIVLESPVVARGNDRFVLRSYSPVSTIGGGRVLDPDPPRRATWPAGLASGEPGLRAEALVLRRPAGVAEDELPLLLGASEAGSRSIIASLESVTLVGGRYISRAVVFAWESAALSQVGAFHRKQPAERGLSLETIRKTLRGPADVVDALVAGLVASGRLQVRDGIAALPGFAQQLGDREATLEKAIAVLDAAGLEAPSVTELEARIGVTGLVQVLRFAAEQGRLVPVERDRYFSTSALNQFGSLLRDLSVNKAITLQALRERTGLTRKYLIPLLEWADRAGITRRVGDSRELVNDP